MPLFQDSGQTPDRRREEAKELLAQVIDAVEAMTDKDRRLVEKISGRFQKYGDEAFVNANDVFWLRDIRDRYV
jgi:hypothetical protein